MDINQLISSYLSMQDHRPVNSPSYLAGKLANVAGMSDHKTKVNGVDTDTSKKWLVKIYPAELLTGNLVHDSWDIYAKYVKDYGKDVVDANEIYNAVINDYDISAEEMEGVNRIAYKTQTKPNEVISFTMQYSRTLFLRLINEIDASEVSTEIKTKVVEHNGQLYGGTIDIVKVNDDGTLTLMDLKNYNGTSEKNITTFFNQLMIYAMIATNLGYTVTELKVYNPITEEWHTRHTSPEVIRAWAESML